MSQTLDQLARDYFAKQESWRALRDQTTPADLGERVSLELATRDAFDAVVRASMKLDEARKSQLLAAE